MFLPLKMTHIFQLFAFTDLHRIHLRFCFSVAYEANFLDVKRKTQILPTPSLNHHRLPPPTEWGTPGDPRGPQKKLGDEGRMVVSTCFLCLKPLLVDDDDYPTYYGFQ